MAWRSIGLGSRGRALPLGALGLVIALLAAGLWWRSGGRDVAPQQAVISPPSAAATAEPGPLASDALDVERPSQGGPARESLTARDGAKRIRGRVIDGTGAPLLGAAVTVRTLAAGEVHFEPEDPERALGPGSALSGADGGFELELEWEFGAIEALVELEGFAPARRASARGETPANLDFGDFVLIRGGTLAGHVRDGTHAPVPGAEILLREIGAQQGHDPRRSQRVARADARGAFVVEDVPVGLVKLAARTPTAAGEWSAPIRLVSGSRRGGVELVVHAGICLSGTVRDVDSAQGLEAEVGFFARGSDLSRATRTLADGSFEICGLRRGVSYVIAVQAEGYGKLQGSNVLDVPGDPHAELEPRHFELKRSSQGILRIVDGTSGAALEGAQLSWSVPSSDRLPRTLNALAVRALRPIGSSDAQGLVAVPPTPPWSAGPLVRAVGFAPHLVTAADWLRAVEGSVEIELWPNRELEVRLAGLEPTAPALVELHLARRRLDEPILGDEPVGRATVQGGEVARFEGLPPDRYVAVARGASSAPAWSPIFTLEEPGALTSITLTLSAGASVTGRVFPLPDAPRPWVRALGPVGFEARERVASNGSFLLSALPPGRFQLWVEEEPLRVAVSSGTFARALAPPHAQALDLAEGAAARLDLEFEGPAALLSGTVEINGWPAPDLLVRASSIYRALATGMPYWGPPLQTRTDSEGRFELSGVRGHSVQLSATHVGPADERSILVQRTFDRGKAHPSIELRAEVGRISIAVLLERDRSPAPWASIELAPDTERGATQGLGGTWSFTTRGSSRAAPFPLPPGPYILTVRGADGLRADPQPIRIVSGETLELTALLAAP